MLKQAHQGSRSCDPNWGAEQISHILGSLKEGIKSYCEALLDCATNIATLFGRIAQLFRCIAKLFGRIAQLFLRN